MPAQTTLMRIAFCLTLVFRLVYTLEFDDNFPTEVQRGSNVTVSWTLNQSDATSGIEITLMKGPAGNLLQVDTLTTTANGGAFVWKVNDTLQEGDNYALRINSGDLTNFSPLFAIKGDEKQTLTEISSPSSTPTSTSTSTPASQSHTNGGLSIGAKAGIGVGATVGGVILALCAFWLGLSFQRKNKLIPSEESGFGDLKPMICGRELEKYEFTPEIDGKDAPAELSPDREPKEADSTPIERQPQELDTTNGGIIAAPESNLENQASEASRLTPHEDAPLHSDTPAQTPSPK